MSLREAASKWSHRPEDDLVQVVAGRRIAMAYNPIDAQAA